MLMEEAKHTGKTVGELAKDSDGSAKVIQAAFDSTGTGIEKAFSDAAKNRSGTRGKMDEGKAIQSCRVP